jgi:hypothetical protein
MINILHILEIITDLRNMEQWRNNNILHILDTDKAHEIFSHHKFL